MENSNLIILTIFFGAFAACDACAPGSGVTGLGPNGTPSWQQMAEGLRLVLQGTFNGQQYISDAHGDPIQTASDLNCDGSSICRWANVPTPPDHIGDFIYGTGQADPTRWSFITGTSAQPNGKYLIIGSGRREANQNGQLVSDPIDCQNGDGTLSFRHWVSSDTQLVVCIREPPGDPAFKDCSGVISKPQNPGPTKVRVRGRQSPFEIVFVAKNFVYTNPLGEGGLVALDDISYDADICPRYPSTVPQRVTDPPRPTPPKVNLNKVACELISCDFEKSGAPCMENAGRGGFQLGQGQRGNRNTGIRYDATRSTTGGYLWAQGPGQKTFSTPDFELGEDAELRFDVFDGTYDTLFLACAGDDPSRCGESSAQWTLDTKKDLKQYEWLASDNSRLRSKNVPLKKGKQRVAFVADMKDHENAWVALDNVKLIDKNGKPLC